MVALPARPSPMAAPIAPPPSARPAAISAPIWSSAWAVVMWSLSSSRCGVCSRPVMLFLEPFTSHTEVNDGQKHEDERLDGADEENIEELPGDQQDHPYWRRGSLEHRRPGKRDVAQGEQEHHHEAAEDVAEQPECKAEGLRDLLDDVQRRERDARPERQLERLGEAAEVTAKPEDVDAVPLNNHNHRKRHREREVDIRGCGLHRRSQREEV